MDGTEYIKVCLEKFYKNKKKHTQKFDFIQSTTNYPSQTSTTTHRQGVLIGEHTGWYHTIRLVPPEERVHPSKNEWSLLSIINDQSRGSDTVCLNNTVHGFFMRN